MPMAISMVGAAVVWGLVYDYRPPGRPQVGILNGIVDAFGGDPIAWLQENTLHFNSFLLMVMLLWMNVGFAMVLLSAAVKGVPTETLEAARIDGAGERQVYFRVVLPQIKGTIITVFITVLIGVMKVFDIVFVMTNGNFNTNVIGNEFYLQFFNNNNQGAAAAIVVMLMLAIDPDHDLPGPQLPGRGGRTMTDHRHAAGRRSRSRLPRAEAAQGEQSGPGKRRVVHLRRPRASSCCCGSCPRSASCSRRSAPATTRPDGGWWELFLKPSGFGDLTFENYQRAVQGTNLGEGFVNSLAIALPATFIPILVAAFAAYAFTFMKFPGRDILFVVIVGMLVVPNFVSFVPMLQIYRDLGMGGTFPAVWLFHVGFGMSLAIFMIRNYMATLPLTIIESAKIDGASHFQTFFRLVLPMSVPVLASFAIFQFLWVWNDLLVALVFLGPGENAPDDRVDLPAARPAGPEPGARHRIGHVLDDRADHRVPVAAAVLRPRPDRGSRQGLTPDEYAVRAGVRLGPRRHASLHFDPESESMLFPSSPPFDCPQLTLELGAHGDLLPRILWTGVVSSETAEPSGYPSIFRGPGGPMLGEHAHELFTRPHLRGHRVRTTGPRRDDGLDHHGVDAAWSTRFTRTTGREHRHAPAHHCHGPSGRAGARDRVRGASGRTPPWSTHGDQHGAGHLRARVARRRPAQRPTTSASSSTSPAGTRVRRTPQRHTVTDGLWLREGREGRPGLGGATLVVLGTPGFSTRTGTVLGVHVAWSGNSSLRVERSPDLGTTLGGGELLQSGEVVLGDGESYATPWVVFGGSDEGLDGLAAAFHTYERSLRRAPGAPSPSCSTSGRRCGSTTTSPGCRRSPTALPGSASSGSCWTTAGSTVGATTPPGSATGGSTRTCGPRD